MNFREYASKNIVVFDGAMGTSIQKFELSDNVWQSYAGCSEWLNAAAPDVIKQIHTDYLNAGCDIIETNTFGGTELVMGEYGLEDRCYELNLLGAKIAREAADAFGKYVAGSIGPGTRLPGLNQISFDDLFTMYSSQTKALIEGGVDVLIIETCQDLLQVKSAVSAAAEQVQISGKDIPIMVSVTVEQNGKMLMGTDLSAVAALLRDYPVYSLGMNCAMGPDMMYDPLKTIIENWDRQISLIPNAGLPETINGQTMYGMTPSKMSVIMDDILKKFPVDIIGGCCGTTPAHIKELSVTAKNNTKKEHEKIDYKGRAASIYTAVELTQSPAPTLIGERANANGSKAFREMLMADNFEGMLSVAKEQEDHGAHLIDICVAYAGRNEVSDMKKYMALLNSSMTAPLVFDSTEPEVLLAAMKMYGGKPVINSINLEDGGEKMYAVLDIIKKHPASVIALTIDETGMAMTAEKKFEVAERMYKAWTEEYGFDPHDIIFDPLTFSIGSGDKSLTDAGVQTLKAIKMIKEKLPGAKTTLGLSNISFGLSANTRPVLNSLFMHRAVEAGLDSAIVHASKILPAAAIDEEDAKIAEALIDGLDGSLNAFIERFEGRNFNLSDEEDGNLSPEDKLKKLVMRGRKDSLKETLDKLREIYKPLDIINNILLTVMKEIGVLFGEGKMLLPFVLQSAEVMKAAVEALEPYMERNEGETKGKIVLATVKGDVHDIGKNLVEIILTNNGFTVYNLGIKIEAEQMIEKAKEVGADAIGMSGLLVKSTVIMKENIEKIKSAGLNLNIFLGGAALTPKYVSSECDPIMPSKVHYCKDAFDAMKIFESGSGINHTDTEETDQTTKQPKIKKPIINHEIPEALPFIGIKQTKNINIEKIYEYLNMNTLFRARWGYEKQKLSESEYEALLISEIEPEFQRIKKLVSDANVLKPAVSYGYFKCLAEGDDIILFDKDSDDIIKRFTLPRQNENGLCLADYFSPDKKDIMPVQLVTIGEKAVEFCKKYYDSKDYKTYYMLHGLFTELTESLAEYWHNVIREEMLLDPKQGKRYSFGYSALPDLSGNNLIAEILNSENIGVTMTESHEMVPEYSTSAIIVHNAKAVYFDVK